MDLSYKTSSVKKLVYVFFLNQYIYVSKYYAHIYSGHNIDLKHSNPIRYSIFNIAFIIL